MLLASVRAPAGALSRPQVTEVTSFRITNKRTANV